MSSREALDTALKRVGKGDLVVLADGKYKDVPIVVRASGTENSRITIRAFTPGKAVLTGASYVELSGDYITVQGLAFEQGHSDRTSVIRVNGNNCRITDCSIVDYKGGGSTKWGIISKWVILYGKHNRVDHCYFAGKTTGDVVLQVELRHTWPKYHRIDHNYFGHRPPLGRNGGEIIRLGYSSQSQRNSRTIVEYNLFERCNGEGETISCKSCENVFRYNTFRKCDGSLYLRHGHHSVVEGNFFFGIRGQTTNQIQGVHVFGSGHAIINNYFTGATTGGRGLVRLWPGQPDEKRGATGYEPVKDVLVAFNTFVDNDGICIHNSSAGAGYSGRTVLAENVTVANNLMAGGAGGPLILGKNGRGEKWMGNIAYSSNVRVEKRQGVTVANPRLLLCEDGLWRPARGSPAIGAAKDEYGPTRIIAGISGMTPNVTRDIDGQERGDRKDVGCDQASTEPVRIRPLTPADVGPVWMREKLRSTKDAANGQTKN